MADKIETMDLYRAARDYYPQGSESDWRFMAKNALSAGELAAFASVRQQAQQQQHAQRHGIKASERSR